LPDTSRGVVVLSENVELKPRSIALVTARIESPYSNFDSLIFEPLPKC